MCPCHNNVSQNREGTLFFLLGYVLLHGAKMSAEVELNPPVLHTLSACFC
jgi:hypothetical protein